MVTKIAKLWATHIEKGLKSFSDVPRLLKDQVRDILISDGYEYLIDDNE